jgi:hypothetical protein
VNEMATKEWLVHITTKDWVPGDRHLGYEEVIAETEIGARHIAASQFATRIQYEPIMRRKFEARKLSHGDWCAPEAIEI